MAIERKTFGLDDPRMANGLLELGEVEWRLGNRPAARELFEDCLALLEAAGEERAEQLQSARELLAELGEEI